MVVFGGCSLPCCYLADLHCYKWDGQTIIEHNNLHDEGIYYRTAVSDYIIHIYIECNRCILLYFLFSSLPSVAPVSCFRQPD